MMGRPGKDEAAPYYFRYIDRVPDGDVVDFLERQGDEAAAFLSGFSEDRSLYRYAADKWSVRQVLSHVNDTERLFLFRALWFARGLDSALPSYDQDAAVKQSGADEVSWKRHLEEFRGIRRSTLDFFRNLSADAWKRSGVASDYPFTVRALAHIIGGHLEHHRAVLRERYSASPAA
jgi:hypothetical protein